MSDQNPTSGGPPLRALAMVLIALAIVFAGLGAMSLSSSDSDTSGAGESSSTTSRAAATTAVATANSQMQNTSVAPTSSASTSTKSSTTTTVTTTANHAVPVHVLNNSTVAGLAARTASELTADGWAVAEVGNYPGPNITNTTVFYGNNPGEKEAALAIADQLGVTAELRSGVSGSGVTVVVTGN